MLLIPIVAVPGESACCAPGWPSGNAGALFALLPLILCLGLCRCGLCAFCFACPRIKLNAYEMQGLQLTADLCRPDRHDRRGLRARPVPGDTGRPMRMVDGQGWLTRIHHESS